MTDNAPCVSGASIQIELGWPAKALSPNARSRSHWPKTNASKKAREEAFWATKAALHGRYESDGTRISFHAAAYPPDRRGRDDDNLLASLKPHRDGIAQALGIDDGLFDQRPLSWGEPVKGGRVVITIGGAS